MCFLQTSIILLSFVTSLVIVCNFWNDGLWDLHANVAMILVTDLLPVVVLAHQNESLERISSPEKRHHVTVFGGTSVFPRFVCNQVSDPADGWARVKQYRIVHSCERPRSRVSRNGVFFTKRFTWNVFHVCHPPGNLFGSDEDGWMATIDGGYFEHGA